MIDLLVDIFGFEVCGKFMVVDYEVVFMFVMEVVVKCGLVRLFFVMFEGFYGMEIGVMCDDLMFGFKYFCDFKKFVFVIDDEMLVVFICNFVFMILVEIWVFWVVECD